MAILRGAVWAAILWTTISHADNNERVWQPSTLSPETITAAQQGRADYYGCLQEEVKKLHIQLSDDSRKITDQLMTTCEPKLLPVAGALRAEKVPESIISRYLRSVRVPAAREVLKQLMAMQAVNSAAPLK